MWMDKALSYPAYLQLIESLLAEGKTTGPNQSEAFIHYTQLNSQRMHRVEKTVQLLPEAREKILAIDQPQTWLILTEGWCGDASQILPVVRALADLNPKIALKVLLRDENLELMDRYLTNGTSRSIPKIIGVDPATGKELFNWGPRPTALQEMFEGMRSEGLAFDVMKEELQRWYNKDKGVAIQKELVALTYNHPI